MIKALHTEWLKLKNYRTFWILLGITLLAIPGFTYMFYNLLDNKFPKSKGAQMLLGSPFAFPDVWQTVSWLGGITFIVPAILIITLTTNEFTFRTHRQNIIDGWSRKQFLGVKMVEILILSVLTTLSVLLTTLAFGMIVNKIPDGVSTFTQSRYLFFYFVQMVSYSLISFLLAVLLRRAGLAIGIFFVYIIVEKIILGICKYAKVNAGDYLPEEVTNILIPFPLGRRMTPPSETLYWEHHLPVYLIVAFVYLVIYCLVTGRFFLKSDL